METPKSEVFFEMRPMTWGPRHETKCSKCRRDIKHLEDYFYDQIENREYCEGCGKSLRYHRKKWTERGWPMPDTLEVVEQKMEELGIATRRKR